MEFLDRNVKTMPSLSYTKYFEGIQSYECEDCKTIIYPAMGYCRECVKRRECVKPNLKHLPIFCCECQAPIEDKTDYLLNNNEVDELPQVYLLCNCSKGLWLPLMRGGITTISDYLNADVRGTYIIRALPNMLITIAYISPSASKRKKIFFFDLI